MAPRVARISLVGTGEADASGTPQEDSSREGLTRECLPRCLRDSGGRRRECEGQVSDRSRSQRNQRDSSEVRGDSTLEALHRTPRATRRNAVIVVERKSDAWDAVGDIHRSLSRRSRDPDQRRRVRKKGEIFRDLGRLPGIRAADPVLVLISIHERVLVRLLRGPVA